MNFLWSKYFLFAVLECAPGTTKSSMANQTDQVKSMGSDLPVERTNISLKPRGITEENQTV